MNRITEINLHRSSVNLHRSLPHSEVFCGCVDLLRWGLTIQALLKCLVQFQWQPLD